MGAMITSTKENTRRHPDMKDNDTLVNSELTKVRWTEDDEEMRKS